MVLLEGVLDRAGFARFVRPSRQLARLGMPFRRSDRSRRRQLYCPLCLESVWYGFRTKKPAHWWSGIADPCSDLRLARVPARVGRATGSCRHGLGQDTGVGVELHAATAVSQCSWLLAQLKKRREVFCDFLVVFF